MDFSILIPNWNGEQLISRCLSSLAISAQECKKSFEIIVIDDASTDNSTEIVKEKFNNIVLLKNENNIGFAASVNKGVAAAKGELIVLVNNDIIAKPEFINRLIHPFYTIENNKIFCVSGKTIDWDNKSPNHINMSFEIKNGRIHLRCKDSKEFSQTMLFQGGACAFKRDIFLKLGGFSHLFYPGYWEDYDISYYAQKCGYEILYEPSALALHLGKHSFSKRYGNDAVKMLYDRNKLIFTWLNISDIRYLASHFFLFPLHCCKDLILNNDTTLLKAFIKTVVKLFGILHLRRIRIPTYKATDKEIIHKFQFDVETGKK